MHADAGSGQLQANAGRQLLQQLTDTVRIDLAGIAVAQHFGQGQQGIGKQQHIARQSAEVAEFLQQIGHNGRQVGFQGGIEQSDEFGKIFRLPHFPPGAVDGRFFDGATPNAGFDKPNFEVGQPFQLPVFVESAVFAVAAGNCFAPGKLQQQQPVQKVAFAQVCRFTQIEFQRFFVCAFFQPATAHLLVEICLQRGNGHGIRYGAELVADDQLFVDQVEHFFTAFAEHGHGCLPQFVEPGQRRLPQYGQRFSQPRGFHHVRRRYRQVVLPEQLRRTGQPDGCGRMLDVVFP